MATFQARIEDLVGSQSDTAALTDWCTEGARVVIDVLVMKNSDRLDLYATDKTDPNGSTGVVITGGRAISAHKANYPATRVSANAKAVSADANSIFYALATDPSWYMDKTKAYVLPSGGIVRWVGYPTVAFGDSSISDFPTEAYPAIAYYAAIQSQLRNITEVIRTTMEAVAFSLPSAPSALSSAPSFTWTDAVAGTYTATTLATTATPPTYTKPSFSGSITQANTYIVTNTDVELAGIELQRQSHLLNEYQTDIQNELNEFNKEMAAYQGVMQQEIEQARLTQERILKEANDTTELNKFNELQTLAEQVQEYQAVLDRHRVDIERYGTESNIEINRVQTLIQKGVAQYQGLFEILKGLKEEYQRIIETL